MFEHLPVHLSVGRWLSSHSATRSAARCTLPAGESECPFRQDRSNTSYHSDHALHPGGLSSLMPVLSFSPGGTTMVRAVDARPHALHPIPGGRAGARGLYPTTGQVIGHYLPAGNFPNRPVHRANDIWYRLHPQHSPCLTRG